MITFLRHSLFVILSPLFLFTGNSVLASDRNASAGGYSEQETLAVADTDRRYPTARLHENTE